LERKQSRHGQTIGLALKCCLWYYRGDKEFQYALAEALRVEYLAIVDAGFIL
jgi:hypothetical protein